MIPNEQLLTKLDHEHLWHPFTQMKDWTQETPLFIKKGKGNYLIDINDKEYIDAVSSLWCNVHGHNKQELNDAIKSQLNEISHSTMLGLSNIPATLLAKKLIDITPAGLNKVFYSDAGACAVEIALKMAFQYWRQKHVCPRVHKQKFIKLKKAYHGDTIGAVSLGGFDLFHKMFSFLLFETFDISCPSFYHSSFSDPKECMDNSLNELRKILDKHHNEVAGLIIEPYVQGAAGIVIYPSGFMSEIQDICLEYEILFIVDEVATGFGKTGYMFACQENDLKPDIMTVGKGLTGGYLPLAATIVSDKIYNAFLNSDNDGIDRTFYHGHTFTGNPIACNCALASLEVFEKDLVLEKMQDKIKYLKEALNELEAIDYVGQIRIKGFMVGIELAFDKRRRKPFDPKLKLGAKVSLAMREYGVIMRPLGDVLVLMPPLSISKDEIRIIIEGLVKAIPSVIKKMI